MACQVYRKNGIINKVMAPNGEESILFNNILRNNPDKESALKQWATSYTPIFQEWLKDNINERIDKKEHFRTWELGTYEGAKETEERAKELDEIAELYPHSKKLKNGELGESFNEFKERALSIFKELIENAPNNSLIVTHSSVLKLFRTWNDLGRKEVSDKEFAQTYNNHETFTGDVIPFDSNNGVLYVVRHGETEDNRAGNFRSSHTKLTEKGIKQAQEVAEALSNQKLANVYSSPLHRAIHTSHIILSNQNIMDKNGEVEYSIFKQFGSSIISSPEGLPEIAKENQSINNC